MTISRNWRTAIAFLILGGSARSPLPNMGQATTLLTSSRASPRIMPLIGVTRMGFTTAAMTAPPVIAFAPLTMATTNMPRSTVIRRSDATSTRIFIVKPTSAATRKVMGARSGRSLFALEPAASRPQHHRDERNQCSADDYRNFEHSSSDSKSFCFSGARRAWRRSGSGTRMSAGSRR